MFSTKDVYYWSLWAVEIVDGLFMKACINHEFGELQGKMLEWNLWAVQENNASGV